MYILVSKITKAFLKQFFDRKWKRRSSKENLVVLLVVKRRRVCSSSICLAKAKPAKVQTNKKKVFKKDFPQHFMQSHCFLYLLFGFCFFWCLSWSVGQNAAWIKLKSELLYGAYGLWFTSAICTFFIFTEKKLHKGVVDYSTDSPLTHLRLMNQFNFNFLQSISTRRG